MKILFCSLNPLKKELGAAKVIIEVASEMSKIGWTCDLASDTEICPKINNYAGFKKLKKYSEALRDFILAKQKNYDVIDYDHASLPFKRNIFLPEKLMVARSVLLAQHFEKIKIPRFEGVKPFLGLVTKGVYRYALMKKNISNADQCCKEADLINVSNSDDKMELISRGFDAQKIVVVPFGMSDKDFELFNFGPAHIPPGPCIAFVGTFDVRKGGAEFYKIVSGVAAKVPNIKFKLLGARYKSKDQILDYFPKQLHKNLEIISNYKPEELPRHLQDCTVGVFPSYVEGFGFGILEMLAASLPVIAYRAPGAKMMLNEEFMVQSGDVKVLGEKLVDLINNKEKLINARAWSQKRARDFRWSEFAKMTSDFYMQHLKEKR